MRSDTGTQRFNERTMRQVSADAKRALARARYCPQRSVLEHLRCADSQPESETEFGRQLWYFNVTAVDEVGRTALIYGVVEYSLQYGLHELVEDGVFPTLEQRDRFEKVYRRQPLGPSWRHPSHRWLIAGMFLVAIVWLSVLLLQRLMR